MAEIGLSKDESLETILVHAAVEGGVEAAPDAGPEHTYLYM